MKTRNDFVSNSSSCSFIIQIIDKKEKDKFFDIVSKYNLTYNDFWESDVVDISNGDWFEVYCGEDSLENIDRFRDIIQPAIEGLNANCFMDEFEHETFGEKLKRTKRV